MALLYMNGFDSINSIADMDNDGWTSTIGATFAKPPRYSPGYAGRWYVNASSTYNHDWTHTIGSNQQTLYMGLALKYSKNAGGGPDWYGFSDSGTDQIGVAVQHNTMLVGVFRGGQAGTQLGSWYDANLQIDEWFSLGIEAYIHDTAGTVEVWCNGFKIFDLSTQDTQESANAYANEVTLNWYCSYYPARDIDDFYYGDNTGSDSTAYLGDCKIVPLNPDADGNHTGWVASAGNKWDCIDDSLPNDDTDYIYSSTVADQYTATYDDLPTTGTVYGVTLWSQNRKSDVGGRKLKHLCRSGGTTYDVGSAYVLQDNYIVQRNLLVQNPNGPANWTKTTVDAVEFGMEVDA